MDQSILLTSQTLHVTNGELYINHPVLGLVRPGVCLYPSRNPLSLQLRVVVVAWRIATALCRGGASHAHDLKWGVRYTNVYVQVTDSGPIAPSGMFINM